MRRIKALKTWQGPEGLFFKGLEYDVDDAVLEKIGSKKFSKKRLWYKEVPAWWDAQKDERAVRVAELQGAIAKATVELERLEDELLNMQYRAGPSEGSAVDVLENAEHDHERAEQLFRQVVVKAEKAAANAAKKPTEANIKKAEDLDAEVFAAARAMKEAGCLARKAQGQLLVLDGDIGLTEIEVADARAELAAMQDELHELRPDIKPKDHEDGPNEKPKAPEGSPDGKDAADAEGQTVAAGQVDGVQNEVAGSS